MADAFRCSAAAGERGDDLAGTASTVRSYLLLEHPGSWGVDALRDARLPDGLGPELARRGRATGVRVLLVRRGRRAARPRVLAARAQGADSWLETTAVADLRDVLDLDLERLGRGESLGLPRETEPVLAVCTHGRHDACCAEQGRPVVRALAGEWPEQVWECSHIGGDRFAGNLLVLPHGLYYGRLDPASARRVAEATTEGRVVVEQLRGRSDLPMPVQAAEIELRRRLGEDRRDVVVPTGHSWAGDLVTAGFEVDGRAHAVVVRASRSEPELLTCRSAAASSGWRFEPG